MQTEEQHLGRAPDGSDVVRYTLQNSHGMRVSVLNYGGILESLWVPDCNGVSADVVLGYDRWEDYLNNSCMFGAMIGRCANRIAGASYRWRGRTYPLSRNYGQHHLHGGFHGFDQVTWQGTVQQGCQLASIALRYLSRDGEEGYPGNLQVCLRYTLYEDNTLELAYEAQSDADTLVNLTNHSYFNLSGGLRQIQSHRLMMPMCRFAAIDTAHMPTGEIQNVSDTALDFHIPAELGPRLCSGDPQVQAGGGFDHSWLMDGESLAQLRLAAQLEDPDSGRMMAVYTTMPAVQVFTPDFAPLQVAGKRGTTYRGRDAICFETNYVPNAIALPCFDAPVLQAGQLYAHKTLFKFSAKERRYN